MEALQSFGIFLMQDDRCQFLQVEAATPHLAARMAEHSEPGWTVAAVTTRLNVAGKCCKCNSILFDDARPRSLADGRLRCLEC